MPGRREFLPEVLGQRAQGVEILAEDLEGDLRAHAREHVVEAMGDRLADIGRHRQHGEPGADVGDDRVLGPPAGLERDLDLGGVDTLGMLVELGAAGAAADALHLRHLHDQALGDEPDPVALGQRDPRA
jgi:hypothetical protein